jgi:hypothetical protein
MSKLRFSFGEKKDSIFMIIASNSSFINMINIVEKRECTMVRHILCGNFSFSENVKMIE